jgi:hypothetical protein
MGMREERLDWASSKLKHSELMFEVTQNPYYLVAAVATARIAEWKVPDWALNALLDRVKESYFESERTGEDLSIDRALGLKTKRGGTPAHRKAWKTNLERSSFKLVQIIHYCFAISIPEACEIFFQSIDNEFAQGMEEYLFNPAKCMSQYEPMGNITREIMDEMDRKHIERSKKEIESGRHTADVVDKLRRYAWWEVTRGDRLGYSLEKFIDRYYREGTKLKIDFGKASEDVYMHAQGLDLLFSSGIGTRFFFDAEENMYVAKKHSLAGLKKRDAFASFHSRCSNILTVPKHDISGQ